MKDLSLELLVELSVISESDPPDIVSMYRNAVEQLDLLAIDYQTIRDLITLASSPDPALHGVLIALFSSLAEGSVCLRLTPDYLGNKITPITGGKNQGLVKAIITGIRKHTELVHILDESSPALFEDPCESFKPLILVTSGDAEYLYFHKYYIAEKNARNALALILARKQGFPADLDALRNAVRDVLKGNQIRRNNTPVMLNREQQLAVLLPALMNFVIISGGPGTGKTFIVLNLLRIMTRLGISADRIKIAAPTGRAAQKLTDSIQKGIASLPHPDDRDIGLLSLQGTTLHRLLQYSPSRDMFLHGRGNPVPADLIIIDEASMIDILLLGKLFEALEERACLVMLGDRNQLPSVEAGAVLADLIPGDHAVSLSPSLMNQIRVLLPDPDCTGEPPLAGPQEDPDGFPDRVVILHESYRSEKSIQEIADGIKRQDPSTIGRIPAWKDHASFPENGVWLMEPGATGESRVRELHRILRSWSSRHYLDDRGGSSYRSLVEQLSGSEFVDESGSTSPLIQEALSRLDEARILTPLKSGLSGADGINGHLQGELRRIFDPVGYGSVFSGAPVIITKNDYNKELFNGDVGLILRGTGSRYFGVFNKPGGFKVYPVESLPPFGLSFAITVHKSQGSEYESVLLVVPEGVPERLLTREILYTGLTRAQRLVVLYAARSSLSQALRNRTERESRIRLQ